MSYAAYIQEIGRSYYAPRPLRPVPAAASEAA